MHLPMPPRPSVDPASFSHTLVVVLVVVAATTLRAFNDLDTPTISTVYGAALGFASGLSARPRPPADQ